MKMLLALTATVLAVLLFAGTDSATAGDYLGVRHGGYSLHHLGSGFYLGQGNYDYGRSYHGGRHFGRSHSGNSYGRSYGGTAHWDYHPTTIRRHGDHFDVQPGHFDLHHGSYSPY